MVVLDRRGLVEKLAAVEPLRRAPDRVGQPRRRVLLAADAEIAVGDHVDQDESAHVLHRVGLLQLFDVVAAAVGVVLVLDVPVPLHRFLAVEKKQLDRQWIGAPLQRACELEQKGGARRGVAGADEGEVLRQLGVVVAADDDPSLRAGGAGQRGAQVDHVDRAGRRLRVEGLLFDLQPRRGKLLADVVAVLLEGRGAGRARPERDHRFQVLEGPRAVELRILRHRRLRRGTGQSQRDCRHDALHPATSSCRAARSRVAPARDKSAAAARSSDPGRSAFLPTARSSRPCAGLRRAPGTCPPGSPSPGR